MNNFLKSLKINRPWSILEKIEFWIATVLYFIGVIAVFSEDQTAEGSLLGAYYLKDLLLISSFYVFFLLLNFIVLPRILNMDYLLLNIIIITVFIIITILFFPNPEHNFLLFSMAIYFGIKAMILFLWRRFSSFREEKGNFFAGILMAFISYLLLMLLLFAGDADRFAQGIPGLIIPFAIILYAYSFRKLIPQALQRKKPFRSFLLKVILILLVAAVPFGVLGYLILLDEEIPFVINILNFFVQLLFIVPLAWFTYKRQLRGKEEITTLKKELGQSTAKFDFLRSQINPHFLFNALNTLYGTALQENAERTGEGIQQLGDMMRFMLHENMQEKISLARETEYLNNYINLQRLRTDPNPNVIIRAEIPEIIDYAQISPMLLIPFVENAFKHGISFREPSHIKITLEKKENIIYFDVYNSRHPRLENDPEKDKTGIGLPNVKQRLELLYPKKHDLVIRETGKEFFVHLTLDLS